MIEIYNLTDPFRELYPDLKRYTWRKRTPLKQARLDFLNNLPCPVTEERSQQLKDI
jgi:hypothetical protein